MKTSLAILSLCLLFFSCKKEKVANTTNPNVKTYDVKFKVSGFTQTQGKISSLPTEKESSSGLAKHIKYLSYFLFKYDETADTFTILDSLSKDSSDNDFGTFSIKIAPGKYKVTVLGSNRHVSPDPFFAGLIYYSDNTSDLFLKNMDIEVKDTQIEQEVVLNRVVGQLEIVLKDPVPSDLEKIEVVLSQEAQAYLFLDYKYPLYEKYLNYTDVSIVKTIQPSDAGKSNYKMSMFVLNSPSEAAKGSDYGFKVDLNVQLKTYYKGESTPLRTLIPAVDNKPNVKTTLTGKLFDKNDVTGFNVTVDSAFSDHNEVTF